MIRLSNDQAHEIRALILSRELVSKGQENILRAIDRQLPNDDEEISHCDRSLIDFIEGIVSRPDAKSVLSHAALDLLRETLLSQRDLAVLKHVCETSRGCSQCGTALQDGELLTLARGNISCPHCLFPWKVPCMTCHEQFVEMPLKIKKFLLKQQCEKCKAGEEAQGSPQPEAPAAPPATTGGELRPTDPFREWNFRGNAEGAINEAR